MRRAKSCSHLLGKIGGILLGDKKQKRGLTSPLLSRLNPNERKYEIPRSKVTIVHRFPSTTAVLIFPPPSPLHSDKNRIDPAYHGDISYVGLYPPRPILSFNASNLDETRYITDRSRYKKATFPYPFSNLLFSPSSSKNHRKRGIEDTFSLIPSDIVSNERRGTKKKRVILDLINWICEDNSSK